MLLIREEDIKAVEACIEEHKIEILRIAEIMRDVNPMRDRYC